MMKQYWLITTAHLEDTLWFRDDEDFKVGMNYVAVLSQTYDVRILAFILMSNHVHFVLHSGRDEAGKFINEFKRRYSIYMGRRWGFQEFLRRNDVDLKPLPDDEPDALERAIAYVQMNCVAGGICAHPSLYPWGTGSSFFSMAHKSSHTLGQWSARKKMAVLHIGHRCIPDNWIVSEEGYICPENYIDVQGVEARFRTPERMNYFLRTSSKARKRLEVIEDKAPSFRDQVILSVLPDLCMSLFQKRKMEELTPSEKVECLRQIRYRFSANINQLARVAGLSYAETARLLDEM